MSKFISDWWFAWLMMALVGAAGFGIYKAPVWKMDNVKYKAEYYLCINNLPAGPNSTVYNDWDEVMEECQFIATKLSRYCANC